jgi:hypothetical protein
MRWNRFAGSLSSLASKTAAPRLRRLWSVPLWLWLWLGLTLGQVGCETAGWNGRLLEAFAGSSNHDAELEERHRSAYVQHRTRSDLYWLLGHRIETGMTVAEVAVVLGERGEKEPRGQWVRQGDFRIDDEIYRYGPDSEGQSVYLVYREGRLVNHNREDFTRKNRLVGKSSE